jgi:predicted aspartyl protease
VARLPAPRAFPRGLVLALALAAAAPPPARGGDGAPDEAVVASLPFLSGGEPGLVYADLAQDGQRGLVLLVDTGASYSVLSPLFARKLGVSVRSLKSTPYRRPTRLGRELQFWVDTSSSDTGSRSNFEYGLLGGNFLSQYVLELDFVTQRVRFLDPDRFAVPERTDVPEEVVVPIRTADGRPTVDVSVDGHTIPAVLDTGAAVTMIVSGRAAKSVGIDAGALAAFGELYLTAGRTTSLFAEAREIAIGGVRFAQVPLLVAPMGLFNAAGTGDSLLGMDLISRFRVRIDYPRKRLWLARETGIPTFLGIEYVAAREAGAFMQAHRDGYAVRSVSAGGPAAQRGLQPGDWIARADRWPTPESLLRAVKSGAPITVKRRAGDDEWQEVELTGFAAAPPP